MRWKRVKLQRSGAHPWHIRTSENRRRESSDGGSVARPGFAMKMHTGHPSAMVAKLGNTVYVQDLSRSHPDVFTLVEPHNSQPAGPLLSIQSPLGQALQDTTAGDLVEIVGRNSTRRLLVKAVLPTPLNPVPV